MSVSAISAWALTLPVTSADALVPLRLCAGVEIGAQDGLLWLRGQACDPALANRLAALPASRRYAWLEGDRLQPRGSYLATDRLPAVTWQPLSAWLRVSLPVATLPGATDRKARLALVPSSVSQQANAIHTDLETWAAWARQAPLVRLKSLRFAASTDGSVLILGTPPPSLPGQALVEKHGIVIPAGLEWAPQISAVSLRRLLGAGPEAVVYWDDRGVRLLGVELFVAASRASARATLENSPRFAA